MPWPPKAVAHHCPLPVGSDQRHEVARIAHEARPGIVDPRIPSCGKTETMSPFMRSASRAGSESARGDGAAPEQPALVDQPVSSCPPGASRKWRSVYGSHPAQRLGHRHIGRDGQNGAARHRVEPRGRGRRRNRRHRCPHLAPAVRTTTRAAPAFSTGRAPANSRRAWRTACLRLARDHQRIAQRMHVEGRWDRRRTGNSACVHPRPRLGHVEELHLLAIVARHLGERRPASRRHSE